MPKEKHPYIENHFDVSKPWKYLFIGTFPPNKAVREGKKSLTDYFYGNKGFLWKIIGKIYTDFIQKEKAHPSHFLKFLFSNPHCTHLVLPDTSAHPSQN
jgi:hypothetical protein